MADHVNTPVCLSVLLVCLTILLHPAIYNSILLSNIIFFILLPLPTHYNGYSPSPSIILMLQNILIYQHCLLERQAAPSLREEVSLKQSNNHMIEQRNKEHAGEQPKLSLKVIKNYRIRDYVICVSSTKVPRIQ